MIQYPVIRFCKVCGRVQTTRESGVCLECETKQDAQEIYEKGKITTK